MSESFHDKKFRIHRKVFIDLRGLKHIVKWKEQIFKSV